VCDPCRRGDFVLCQFEKITGLSFDCGYAEYMVAPAEAVAALPDDLSAGEAAPLLCAGITVYNSLRNAGARAGDVVAVQGIGGLGHLGIQYARQMGFHTVGIGRGGDKEPLARKLGAHTYVDTNASPPAAQLQQLGGARDSRHRTRCAGDRCFGRGTRARRKIGDRGRQPGASQYKLNGSHSRAPEHPRVAFGHRQRFRGHAAV
jgi:NADPH:quinone reductase-like Zn-dependent oxidoreductase